jgi:hypothetical protein
MLHAIFSRSASTLVREFPAVLTASFVTPSFSLRKRPLVELADHLMLGMTINRNLDYGLAILKRRDRTLDC